MSQYLAKTVVTILLLLGSHFSFSQLSDTELAEIDSLKKIVESNVHDTLRVKALIQWDNMIYFFDPETDKELNNQILEICEKNLASKLSNASEFYFEEKKSYALNNLGIIATGSGNNLLAIEYLNLSLESRRKTKFVLGIISCYVNMGNSYSQMSEYSEASECFYNTLKESNLALKTEKDSAVINSIKKAMSDAYTGLGTIAKDQDDIDKAEINYQKALEISIAINDPIGIASGNNNLGVVWANREDYDMAVKYFKKSMDIRYSIGDGRGLIASFINLGGIYEQKNDLDSAAIQYHEALKLSMQMDDSQGVGNSYFALGKLESKKGNKSKGHDYLSKSIEVGLIAGNRYLLHSAYAEISLVNEKSGNYKDALAQFKLYHAYLDTIKNEENTKKIIQDEIQFEYDLKATEDSINYLKETEISKLKFEQQSADLKASRWQKYGLAVILSLALLVAYLIFKRLKNSQEQKRIIEEQKFKVEVAHQEIQDSIAYAKRIQNAILPPSKLFNDQFVDSFVLYKPKDVVAGDFYWMESQEDCVLFAAADCTGHGVPGAMVSVICNSGLNRSVREFGLVDPGKILDKTCELVIKEFEKSEEEVRDGMDIALCSLKGNKLEYAGAHNPLWIIRQGTNEVEEIKADKQPIGKYAEHKPFSTHKVQLNPGDRFYVFSDGYYDQFGGEKGKKFKAKNFKTLLLSVQNENMDRQKERIDEFFEKWKENLEQLDDVCVIGVQV